MSRINCPPAKNYPRTKSGNGVRANKCPPLPDFVPRRFAPRWWRTKGSCLWGAVCATTELLRTACLLHDLLNLPHDLLNRSHDLLYRSYDLLNLPHDLLNRSHDLLYRSYVLLNLPHDLLNLPHDLLNREVDLL